MKKLLCLLLAMICVSFAYAQKVPEAKVPAAVKSGLQKKHPIAKDLKWEKENGNYEVGFTVVKTRYTVLLDTMGNIIETEVAINIDELPAMAKEYTSKKYAGQKIKDAAKIVDNKGVTTYEAGIKDKDLIFDNAGKFIKEAKD